MESVGLMYFNEDVEYVCVCVEKMMVVYEKLFESVVSEDVRGCV